MEDNAEKANIGFVEAKQLNEAGNHYKINMDLIRLGVFSKNAIDINKLSGVLAIQAVGRCNMKRTSTVVEQSHL
jgi:hypothetical protein